jgi:hypothetical protein
LVRFADACYRIPLWNAQPVRAPSFWDRVLKRPTRSISLVFSHSELAERIEGYVPSNFANPQSGLLVGLFAPTPEETATMHANTRSMHHDLWYAAGDYTARTVEPIAGTGYYRVSALPNGNNWMIVTRMPDAEKRDSHLVDGFWIGGCVFLGERRVRSCTTNVELGRLVLTLHTIEKNLQHRAGMAEHVARKFDEWKVPCG